MELSALVGNLSGEENSKLKPPSYHCHPIIIVSSSSYHCHDLINHHYHPHFITIIFLASHRHESGNAREATDKYRGNYKPSIDMKTKILCIFVFLSGCCFIALLHSCFPHVWLFVTSCTFTFLSCICYFAFPLFCCVIIVLHFTFKCFIYVFHCLLFIFMWFFFIRYRIFPDRTSREFLSGSVN